MAIPTSPVDFDIFDWNSTGTAVDAASPNGLLAPNSTLSRGAPFIDAAGGKVTVFSPDLIATRLTTDGVSVPANFSFEFEATLDKLPEDFNDPTSTHAFVGVLNAQGHAGGFLFSEEGIALTGGPNEVLSVLSGSQGLIVDDDLTFRIVVNADTKLANIYVTLSSQLASTGHVLRHTVEAPFPSLFIGDAAVVECLGTPTTPSSLDIKSYRLSSKLLIPNKRPIAVVSVDQAVAKNYSVSLDGTGSYDPEDSGLAYKWVIKEQPDGSNLSLSGMQKATAAYGTGAQLTVSGASGPFTSGETITGGTSGATAANVTLPGSYILYQSSSALFSVGETITGSLSANTATIVSIAYGNRVEFTATGKGQSGNGQIVEIIDPGVNPVNDKVVVNVDEATTPATIEITLRNESAVFGGRSDAREIMDVLSNVSYVGYNPKAALLVTAALPAGGINNLEMEAAASPGTTVTLSGGSDSNLVDPVFYPTVTGLYEFELTVNDGELDSLPAKSLINCLESPVAIGDVPNADFVWSYLGSFWKKISDRGRITTIWSSMMQIVASEMIRAWTTDYSKSINDVPSKATHKWVGFSTRSALAGTVKDAHLGPETPIQFLPVDDEDKDLTTRVLMLDKANLDPAISPLTVMNNFAIGSVPILAINDKFEMSKIQSSATYRTSGTDGSLTAADKTFSSAAGTFLKDGVQKGDTLVIESGVTSRPYRGSFTIESVTNDGSLELREAVPFTEAALTYQIGGLLTLEQDVVEVYSLVDSGTKTGRPEDDGDNDATTPTFGLTYSEFSSQTIGGDYLRIGTEDPAIPDNIHTISSPTASQLTISPETSIYEDFLDWQIIKYVGNTPITLIPAPYIELEEEPAGVLYTGDEVILKTDTGTLEAATILARSEKYVGFITSPTLPTSGLTVVKFALNQRVPIHDDVVEAPRLQAHGSASEYVSQNVDFDIAKDEETNQIQFLPSAKGEDGAVASGSPNFTDTGADFTGMENKTLLIFDPDPDVVGSHTIKKVVDANTVELDKGNFNKTVTAIKYEVAPYNNHVEIPETLWGEYVYVDNWEVIENNFGILVGLKHEDIKGTDLSYLSAVKALWFTLWHGPTVTNIRLAGSVFAALPFAEAKGTIIDIEETLSDTHGRILIRDDRTTDIVRSYTYPKSAGLATNPDTGVAYVVNDTVEAYVPLSEGIQVEDYVNNPDWYSGILTGQDELKKFHTFRISLDLDAAVDTKNLGLAVNFVRRVKPAHTNFYLIGLKTVVDEISVSDALVLGSAPECGNDTLPDQLMEVAGNYWHSDKLVFPATASLKHEYYKDWYIEMTSGSLTPQRRRIASYDSSSPLGLASNQIATLDSDWFIGEQGTAQAGGVGSITLAANASSADDVYIGWVVYITGGLGADQAMKVLDYDGTTKVVSVGGWTTDPDNTSTYKVVAQPLEGDTYTLCGPYVPRWPVYRTRESLYSTSDGVIAGDTAQGGGATSIQLVATAVPTDDYYNGMLVRITNGTGADQLRTILDYTGSSTTADVAAWDTTPDGTSVYEIVNPPPFPAGASNHLDHFDGRGNWNKTTDTIDWPMGGEAPTAIVSYSSPVGTLLVGERITNAATGSFVGVLRLLQSAATLAYLDVTGGSMPTPGHELTGELSGAFIRAISITMGAWPVYAHINRERSEIWLPLDPDTVIGPQLSTGTLTSATGAPNQTVTLDAGSSSEDDAYANHMIKITSNPGGDDILDEFVRIESYVGSTKVATLAKDFTGDPDGNEGFSLHYSRNAAALAKVDFFNTGTTITGSTDGEAKVNYFGPSYLRVVDPTKNPYEAFSTGDTITGSNNESAKVLSDVVFVYPDTLTTFDRDDEVGPMLKEDYRACFYVATGGEVPTMDMGLVLDDLELFQYPLDAAATLGSQTVPSHGPGLYWWLDNILVYEAKDVDPAGPGPEPLWAPLPMKGVADIPTSAGLEDLYICRSVITSPSSPPGDRAKVVPDPVLESVIDV